MYKEFNEKHDAVITMYYYPKTKEAKEGDSVPHGKIVSGVQFYERVFNKEQRIFHEILLSKEFILELAEQIKRIESEEKFLEYNEVPF